MNGQRQQQLLLVAVRKIVPAEGGVAVFESDQSVVFIQAEQLAGQQRNCT